MSNKSSDEEGLADDYDSRDETAHRVNRLEIIAKILGVHSSTFFNSPVAPKLGGAEAYKPRSFEESSVGYQLLSNFFAIMDDTVRNDIAELVARVACSSAATPARPTHDHAPAAEALRPSMARPGKFNSDIVAAMRFQDASVADQALHQAFVDFMRRRGQ